MTTTLSDQEIEEKIIDFGDGILGFPDLQRFLLVDFHEDGVFQELKSIDDPDVAMIVCSPWFFVPDYVPVLSDAEQAELALEHAEDAVVLVPVSFDSADRQVYLNLLGPFIVNITNRKGLQVVLTGTTHSPRTPVDIDFG